MSSDNSATDFLWQITLLSEGLREVALNDTFNEWHEFATKVVRRFLRHLCGQVVHTREEDIVLGKMLNLLFE